MRLRTLSPIVNSIRGLLHTLADLVKKNLQIMAHEICPVVASSQSLQPDPCHNENGGRL
jgi:hypothetical protein